MAVEQEFASDVSEVAEPEIERAESSEKAPEKEPDESAASEDDRGEAGCPIRMGEFGDVRCGRKFHAAPDGLDEKSVCLMHSRDPNKQSGPLFKEFWLEFERILKAAGEGAAHFERFVFPQLDFSKREFQAICRFDCATFTQNANFFKATFTKDTDFTGATFTQYAYFWNATFTQAANFLRATFTLDANFSDATFTRDANFFAATFTQAASFVDTTFHGTADWRKCKFLNQAEFRQTKFEPLVEGQPSAAFALASFSKPGEIVFDDVDLSRVLFHNCDVSQALFTSSVRWAKREGNRGLAVFEETIDLGQQATKGLQRNGQRDYRAVEQIYHQLKKNYDARLDYWTANEFHFGEMEMKRLAGPTDGPLLWLHRNLSFVAWYRWASDYGNSYGKPALWLLFLILFLFPALFPLHGVGLKRQGDKQAETYDSRWDFQKGYGENLWLEARLFGKSAITSIDTATFQRNADYTPAFPWGHVLAIFETLLTSTLFALFLLAIRRQFRR
ncbi:MAG: pentapeptide repeat-containing protein [Terracidiphilus sp.]